MSDAPVALAAGAVVAGAFAGERLGPSPALTTFVLAAVCLAGARCWRRRSGPAATARFVLGLAALALVSAGLMQRALDGLDGAVAEAARRGDHITADVRLVGDPRGSRYAVEAVARLRSRPGPGSLILVRASGEAAMRIRLLTAGEGAAIEGRLRPLAGFEERQRWRHVAAALDVDELVAVSPAGSVMGMANRVRQAFLAGGRYLPPDDAALVAGLLVGDDRHLPAGVTADFRDAGLSHLLAVSGANVALVLGLVAPALRRLSLAGRFVAGMAVVALFAAVTRAEPSVLRASVMAGLGMLAVLLGRPATGRRILLLAVGALVLFDPFLIHSTGFRLSCAASLGIVLLAPTVSTRLQGPRWMREALSATAAAQIGVAPVALPTFGSLPLIALAANLLVAPAVAALSVYGTAWSLVTAAVDPLIGGWSRPLALPATALAAYVRAVAAVAAQLTLPVRTGHLLLLVPVAAVVLFARSKRRGRLPEPSPTRAGDRARHGPDRGAGATGRRRR